MEKKFNENGVQIYDYYIYRVTLITDGRTYIGKRYISLWYTPAEGMDDYTPGEYYGSGSHIINAVKKYGVENFTREVIDEYHDITKTEIKAIEKWYIEEEWAAGHGEFNYSSQSHGGNLYDGMPNTKRKELTDLLSDINKKRYERGEHNFQKLTPKQRSERSKKAAATTLANGTNPLQNMPYEVRSVIARESALKRAAEGTHPLQNLTPEQLSERSRKAMATMGPEGLSAKAKKSNETLGPEGRSARAKKANKTLGQEGRSKRALAAISTLGHDGCIDRGFKSAKTLGPEGCKERTRKATETMLVKWIFYNPGNNEYRIHNLFWKGRVKKGFTDKLCKLSDWLTYCSTHDLDPDLINYKEYLDKD